VQLKGLLLQSNTHTVLQHQSLRGLLVHIMGEILALITLLLGLVHGYIGATDQRSGVVTVFGYQGYSDARPEIDFGQGFVPFEYKGFADRIDDFLGNHRSIGASGQMGEQDNELIPAKTEQIFVCLFRRFFGFTEAIDIVAFPQTTDQTAGAFNKDFIPHIVSQRIVDFFESVQIHKQ